MVGLAIAAVKALDVTANRDIASARKVAVATMLAVAIDRTVSGFALYVDLLIVTSNHPS